MSTDSKKMALLYVVATPIGNLRDITLRAIDVLKSVDLIAAEDTRHSRLLLDHYGILTKMTSLHGDNEEAKTASLLKELKAGKSIALISDAGTPLISDPGEYLVKCLRAEGIQIIPIPGPSALITALSVSGLSTKRFCFEGFLPHKGRMRRETFESLKYDMATLIFYESRHRIIDFLALAAEVFGANRNGVIARELTKHYEIIHADTLGLLHEWVVSDSDQQKGEYVILIEGAPFAPQSSINSDKVLQVLRQYLPTKQAAKAASEITGESQRDLYQALLQFKS